MNNNQTVDPRKKIPLDMNTLLTIEKVVYDEAGNQGKRGRDAVRAVIYNRVAAGVGGEDVLSVLNAKNQFQGVWEKAKGDARRLVVPDSVRDSLLAEHMDFLKRGEDPTGGATFFLNKAIAKKPFNVNFKGLKIGDHEFFNHYNGRRVEVPKYEVALRGGQSIKGGGSGTAAAAKPADDSFLGRVKKYVGDLLPLGDKSDDGKTPSQSAEATNTPTTFGPLTTTPKPAPGPSAQRYEGDILPLRRGGLVKAAEGGAITSLSEEDEAKFQDWIKSTEWFSEFKKEYGEEPDLSPEANYDYRGAWKAGVTPVRDPYDSNRFHWSSTDPESGRMLKSADHPTAWKEYFMQATGKNPDALGIKTPEDGEMYIQSSKDGMAAGGLVGGSMKAKMYCGGMMAPEFEVGYDEESGNPIPPGSLPSEVRDDIPAMLSEGEFVLPADVVRWHGLKHIMDMRAEAKMGLMAMTMEGLLHEGDPVESEEIEDDEETETPEGNKVTKATPKIEEEGMELEEEEDGDEYAKMLKEPYGDERVIVLMKTDPSLFRKT